MPQVKQHNYTIEDIYALPDGERAELIDGQIYYMAPPSTTHQRVLNYLSTEINLYIRSKNGKCEVFPAPFSVYPELENDGMGKYLEPDISIICDKDKLDEKGCHGGPDWIIEIVSPASKRMDYYTKLSIYRAAGVREYWIVDTMRESVTVYDMENDAAPVIYHFTDKVKVNIYSDFVINFAGVADLIN